MVRGIRAENSACKSANRENVVFDYPDPGLKPADPANVPGLRIPVHLLRRVRIMNIQLGGLKTGEYRKVTGEEYKRLIKLLEGSTSLSEADRRGKRYVAFHPRKEDQVNKWKQRSRE